jgi:glycosyltransferase involved in cell wall biosynthesis
MSGVVRLGSQLPVGIRRAIRRLPGFDRLRSWLVDRPRLPGPAPGELRAVVYLPTWVHWDVMRQRPQYLLSAFAAAGHPVYFVDHGERGVRQEDGVTICGSLRDVPRSGVIIYLHFAPLRHLIDNFDDAAVVYDVLDDLSIYDSEELGLPEGRKVRSHHPLVMERADVILVSNHVLAERHREERPDLVIVDNGVDPETFGKPAQRPDDLPASQPDSPIIGYHGMISTWFDFDLIEGVMRERPGWRFVLVGPVDPKVSERVELLREQPNLTVLGERPSKDMPGYVQGFDVGVIWFEVGRMTEGVTPLKMYEYMAAGIPCVATPIPACIAEPLVDTAGDVAGMVRAIEKALDTDGENLRAAAREHSWEKSLAPALDRLDELGLREVIAPS